MFCRFFGDPADKKGLIDLSTSTNKPTECQKSTNFVRDLWSKILYDLRCAPLETGNENRKDEDFSIPKPMSLGQIFINCMLLLYELLLLY